MAVVALCAALDIASIQGQEKPAVRGRAREFGVNLGILSPGPLNAITDVAGVRVGHETVASGSDVRTGVTAILPHGGNLFQEKVPAAVDVGNGFGKAIGFTQIEELGEIETPILLTNTLNVFRVADAVVDFMIQVRGNGDLRSVNPVVGETNDGYLNDIQGRHVTREHVFRALKNAKGGKVEEGCVGAGTGTLCLGWKGGIGTSSRKLQDRLGGYTVGVLVQTNFGGILTIAGAPVGKELGRYYLKDVVEEKPAPPGPPGSADGSCMIVIATDAPLSPRNLKRLAKRSHLAFGRVGAFQSNGSGDYAIAFSTHEGVRRGRGADRVKAIPELPNDRISPLFLAVVEATEEAIVNSMFAARDTLGQKGRKVDALPILEALRVINRR